MKKYSWLVAIIVALMMIFTFAGCGGDDNSDKNCAECGKPDSECTCNNNENCTECGNDPCTCDDDGCLSCGKDPCPHNDIWECWADKHDFIPGSGGFGGKFTGDLYRTGEFASMPGDMLLFSFTDNEGFPTGIGPLETIDSEHELYEHFGESLMTIGSGAMVGFFFENYIDVTDATTINIAIVSGQSSWSGGILFFHNDDNPKRPLQAQWWSGGGHVNSKYLYGFSNFPALNPGGGAPDFTKLVGFALKSNGHMVVSYIEIITPPPLYEAKDCDCELHHLDMGSFPFTGQRQPRVAADHEVLRAAPANSYLLIYFDNTGTLRNSPGRLGGSSSAIHRADCPCGNAPTTGNLPQRWDFPARENSAQEPNPDYAGGYIQVPIDIIWALMDCQGTEAGGNEWNGEQFNINMYNEAAATGVVLHIPPQGN
jgi:hypothetical protein